ncbi:MAG: TIM barrel protein [Proteobacteria bacterium]|nr:TIM barrel protein [Pseudomonadota bacterium]MDA1057204.1 TIM barrel protein [Pseudomonadota bacterium]
MPRFSANISTLFTEREPYDRITAAADCGFTAFEVQFPYELPIDGWVAAKEKAGLDVSVINLPVGDMTRGGPGLASVPGREGQFRAAVAEARLYVEALQPRCVNLLAGIAPEKLGLAACRATLVENTRYAAEAFAPLGVRVVIEAINTRDRPGFFIATSADAISLIDEVGHPNLALQHDLYHMQIMEGALIETLTRLIHRVAHIQFADVPGRQEPGTGQIDFATVFAAIDALGYDGWVAAEYIPSTRTEDTLHWLPTKE